MAESVGSILKQRREARHLSIGQVAEQTRVRPYYLQALENDDLSSIPSMVQARGFLRIYAEFLGLNLEQLSASSPRPLEPPAVVASAPNSTADQSDKVATESRPRPAFLRGLRDRFNRQSSDKNIAPEPIEPSLPPAPVSQPEPEPFVPVRVHEELPAASEPIVEPEPITKPARTRKTSASNPSAKKSARTKAKKTVAEIATPAADDAVGDAQVKKKIAESPPG